MLVDEHAIMTVDGCYQSATVMAQKRCEGPRLLAETAQQPGSPSTSPKSSSTRRRSRRTIVLNVGGERHEILRRTLLRLPRTRLGRLVELLGDSDVDPTTAEPDPSVLELCDDVSTVELGCGLTRTEYFFDRHPRAFGPVIEFYRTGKLHLVEDICALSFATDLEYWGVDELFIEPCCQYRYTERRDRVNDDIRRDAEALRKALVADEHRGTGKIIRARRWLWNFLEKPQTCIAARVRAQYNKARLTIYSGRIRIR